MKLIKPTTGAERRDIGIRCPAYVADAMDAFCAKHAITRSALVIGLLKEKLGVKSPVDMALEKK